MNAIAAAAPSTVESAGIIGCAVCGDVSDSEHWSAWEVQWQQ